MTTMVYERARREAASLLETAWDGTFPVKLGGITRALDAEVLMEPLNPELSGFIVKKSGEDTAHIVLNSSEPTERQRFTWAHELGHLIERSSVANDDDYSFVDTRSSTRYDLHEFFADEFAGALLMPAREVKRLQEGWMSEAGIASYFGVSIPALRKRLARLRKQPDAA